MSALQASRKYGVPSRTLYDKVKKMGITTGRQVQRKSLPNYPSQFPALSGVSIYFFIRKYKELIRLSLTGSQELQETAHLKS